MLFIAVMLFVSGVSQAQTEELRWQRVDPDSLPAGLDSLLVNTSVSQSTDDRFRVVGNRFRDNWFVLSDVGIHTFQGDWSGDGKFQKTLSPDFNIGVGKWFFPEFGLKVQFGLGNSRGFTEIWTPYATGSEDNPMFKADGTPYWQMKTKWWDINANVMLNLTRIFDAWEGYDTDEHSNQFILSIGLGGVHHYDKELRNKAWGEPYHGPKNEWFGNVELQYSRFFTKSKALSLDVKLRSRIYETHYDLSPIAGHRWDYHFGLNVGVTYYFKKRGWERCRNCNNQTVFVGQPIVPSKGIVPADNAQATIVDCSEYKTFTFYIFYPNNYSGRNDAPVVEDAVVNTVDYLAGGIFTQKKFRNGSAVAGRLKSGVSLRSLKTEDVATEKATFTINEAGVPRGYEMTEYPISLSMNADSLSAFAKRTGYYYAPIYEGDKTWNYRIDDETKTQTLLNRDNYREDTSFCLNAHAGLGIVRENMNIDGDADVYSFSDVYAAIEGYEGYVAQFADSTAVREIRRILTDGTILLVQAEGVATSQDNYTGDNAEYVGWMRNKELSFNRAWTAIKWLRGSGLFENVKRENFVINTLTEPISIVNDASTRGLNAKLNRCARIRISYVIKKNNSYEHNNNDI